ncbi:cell division protein FtsL [Devosia sp.]|uniref:cell division protein FtsL n=1 Tax=Devosia sp. TaxID=1871048 RepID=UPI002FCA366E
MIRNLNIILIFTSVFMLAGVYALKFSIETTASERTALIAEIDSQEGQLSLLKADEAVLGQPGHIEPIVRRHEMALAIAPVKQEQFGAFAALPMRPAKPNSAAMDSLFESLAAGVDPIDAILELEGIE